MPPASTASTVLTSTAIRVCRHCLAEALVGVALEAFPHHADCPQLEKKSGHGLEQLAEGRFANSYGEPPVLPRQTEGFLSCGRCPALPECARAGACGALIADSSEPGGYDEAPVIGADIPEYHAAERLAEELRRLDEKFLADHPWLADRRRRWCRECGATAVEGAVFEHLERCPVLPEVWDLQAWGVRPDWMIDFDPETLTARPPAAIDPRRRTAPHGDPPHLVDFGLVDGEPEPRARIIFMKHRAVGLGAVLGLLPLPPEPENGMGC